MRATTDRTVVAAFRRWWLGSPGRGAVATTRWTAPSAIRRPSHDGHSPRVLLPNTRGRCASPNPSSRVRAAAGSGTARSLLDGLGIPHQPPVFTASRRAAPLETATKRYIEYGRQPGCTVCRRFAPSVTQWGFRSRTTRVADECLVWLDARASRCFCEDMRRAERSSALEHRAVR